MCLIWWCCDRFQALDPSLQLPMDLISGDCSGCVYGAYCWRGMRARKTGSWIGLAQRTSPHQTRSQSDVPRSLPFSYYLLIAQRTWSKAKVQRRCEGSRELYGIIASNHYTMLNNPYDPLKSPQPSCLGLVSRGGGATCASHPPLLSSLVQVLAITREAPAGFKMSLG